MAWDSRRSTPFLPRRAGAGRGRPISVNRGLKAGPSAPPALRAEAVRADVEAVRGLVRATGFFSDQEEAVAAELIEERLARGPASGYEFVFAEQGDRLCGYTCYGLIPLTRASYDLYWIAVHPEAQGGGLGRRLIDATEAAVARAGGTAIYAETSSREQYAPTCAFYRATGYTVAADFPDFYAPGDGKLVFVKRLAEG